MGHRKICATDVGDNGFCPQQYYSTEKKVQSSVQSEEVASHFDRNVYEVKQITFLMQYTKLEYMFN